MPGLFFCRNLRAVTATVTNSEFSEGSDREEFSSDLHRVRQKLFDIEDGARSRAEEFLDVAEEAEEGRRFVDWFEQEAWDRQGGEGQPSLRVD